MSTIVVAPRDTGAVDDSTKQGALATLGIGVFGTGFFAGMAAMFVLASILSKK